MPSYQHWQCQLCPFHEVIQSLFSLTSWSPLSELDPCMQHCVFSRQAWHAMWPKHFSLRCLSRSGRVLSFRQYFEHLFVRYVICVRNLHWFPQILHFKCLDVTFCSRSSLQHHMSWCDRLVSAVPLACYLIAPDVSRWTELTYAVPRDTHHHTCSVAEHDIWHRVTSKSVNSPWFLLCPLRNDILSRCWRMIHDDSENRRAKDLCIHLQSECLSSRRQQRARYSWNSCNTQHVHTDWRAADYTAAWHQTTSCGRRQSWTVI